MPREMAATRFNAYAGLLRELFIAANESGTRAAGYSAGRTTATVATAGKPPAAGCHPAGRPHLFRDDLRCTMLAIRRPSALRSAPMRVSRDRRPRCAGIGAERNTAATRRFNRTRQTPVERQTDSREPWPGTDTAMKGTGGRPLLPTPQKSTLKPRNEWGRAAAKCAKSAVAQFFWATGVSNSALNLYSLPARGLWMELLCLAAQGEPYGTITIKGRVPSNDELPELTAPEGHAQAAMGRSLLARNSDRPDIRLTYHGQEHCYSHRMNRGRCSWLQTARIIAAKAR